MCQLAVSQRRHKSAIALTPATEGIATGRTTLDARAPRQRRPESPGGSPSLERSVHREPITWGGPTIGLAAGWAGGWGWRALCTGAAWVWISWGGCGCVGTDTDETMHACARQRRTAEGGQAGS